MRSDLSASISNADKLSASAIEAKRRKKKGILETSNEIKDLHDLSEIKMLMMSKVGIPFCTNVLRVALNMKEEMIARTLCTDFPVQIDSRMIHRAIKTA